MTWVKICGITSAAARDAAVRGGADALGFVFASGSPRQVTPHVAAGLIADASIPSFIVVVDADADAAVELASQIGAAGVQAHGVTAASVAAAALDAGFSVLRPVPVSAVGPVEDPAAVPPGAVPLFDTASTHKHGGTGVTFPWHVLSGVERRFVLAGGLGVDNVRAAIEAVNPFGVDASSRLESAPGIKDPDTIVAFIEEAKRT